MGLEPTTFCMAIVCDFRIAPVTVFLSEETGRAEVRTRRDRFAPTGCGEQVLDGNPLDIGELD